MQTIITILTNPFVLIFITAYATYIINRLQDRAKEKDNIKSQKLTITEKLNIEVEKLLLIFETLRNDAENNMFLFRNIDAARPSLNKMQSISYEIQLFDDVDLRNTILKTIDSVTTVVDEINGIERFISDEENKFKDKENDALEKLRELKLDLLKMDIMLDDKSKANWIGIVGEKEKSNDKLEVADGLYTTLNSIYVSSKEDLEKNREYCKNKRTFLAIRISTVQTQLKDLNNDLKLLRDKMLSE